MTKTDLLWTRHILDLKNQNYNEYLEEEANAFYHLEDCYLTNILMLSQEFQAQVNTLKKYKYVMAGLKHVVKPIYDYFHIHHVDIKKSKDKDCDSYYTSTTKTIFLHEHLFDDIKDNFENHNFYEEILYILYHEMAHAITDKYFTTNSQHDSNFVYVIMQIFSLILKKPIEPLLEDLVSNSYYKNQVFWVDDFNYLKMELKSFQAAREEMIKVQNCFSDFSVFTNLNSNLNVSDNIEVFSFDNNDIFKIFEYNSQNVSKNKSLTSFISFNELIIKEQEKIERLIA